MEIPAEMVIEELRNRIADLEYEAAVLRARVRVSENGIVKVEEETSG